ncbi:hypothetical protein CCP2SC5_1490002 [Azospirillaceae bacterium]
MRITMIGAGMVACRSVFGVQVHATPTPIERSHQRDCVYEPGLDICRQERQSRTLIVRIGTGPAVAEADAVFILVELRVDAATATPSRYRLGAAELSASLEKYGCGDKSAVLWAGREVTRIIRERPDAAVRLLSQGFPRIPQSGFMRPDRVVIGTDSERKK